MTSIKTKLEDIKRRLPDGIRLVAVSKFHPVEQLREAYDAGQRRFGESRADELVAKAQAMPDDVEWHFIGHIQTNKLRRILPYAAMIQSVDSERLLRLINDEALRIGRHVRVLLQVRVAAEATKTGFTPEELLQAAKIAVQLPAVEVAGVMGMATFTDDEARIRADFNSIASVSKSLRQIIPSANEVSMGMSDDWPVAVAAGSTMVRIGSDIFGPRN